MTIKFMTVVLQVLEKYWFLEEQVGIDIPKLLRSTVGSRVYPMN